MTREEILVALKMDASDLDAKTKQSMAQLSNVAKEHHKWWQHAGTPAKEFHKVLERITEISPLAGEAMRFAIDPLVGALSLAVIGFGFLQKKMEEAGEAAKAMAEKASEAIKNSIDAISALGEVRRSKNPQIANLENEIKMDQKALDENLAKEKKAHLEAANAMTYLKDTEGDILATQRDKWKTIVDQYHAIKQTIDLEAEHLEAKRDKLAKLNKEEEDTVRIKKEQAELDLEDFEYLKKQGEEFEKIAARKAEENIRLNAERAQRAASESLIQPGDANVLGDLAGRNFVSGPLSDSQLRDPDLVGALDAATGGYALRRILNKAGLDASGGIKYKPLSGALGSAARKIAEAQAPTDPAQLLQDIRADMKALHELARGDGLTVKGAE